MKLFHYTTRAHLSGIMRDGVITLATAFVPLHVRPAVWCSLNQHWEETANKFTPDGLGTRESTHFYYGLARIEIDPAAAPHGWGHYKRHSGDPIVRRLYTSAARDGADPREWRVSYEPIGRDKWRAIEVWDGGRWTNYVINAAA